MPIQLKRVDNSLASDWDDFVENRSLNGTFLHTRKFYNHNPLNEKEDHSFLFYRNNAIVGVIPFNLIETEEGKTLNSYSRATYGGFIVSDDTGAETINEMVVAVVNEVRLSGVTEIIVRNPFRIFNKKICDESDYAMWSNGFKIKHRALEIAVELGNAQSAKSSYSDSAKRSVQKGKKIS